MHPTRPCDDCPFRLSADPGRLGGSPATAFVGQTEGPFVIPCHSAAGYVGRREEAERLLGGEVPQCAGAAIYRSNLALAGQFPPAIHSLPADYESVFGSHAEFLAHHAKVPRRGAEEFLAAFPPDYWLRKELADPRVQISVKVRTG